MTTAALPWAHAFRVALALSWIDLKQGLRKHAASASLRARVLQGGGLLFGLGFLALLHVIAYSLLRYLALSPTTDRPHLETGVSTAIWSFLLFVMISGGLMRALVVLHEQDDSSLLLSSPTSARAIVAARLLGNAVQSCLVDGFIIIPWINLSTFVSGDLNYLSGYPVWFAIAIMVTCIDGLFSFGLIGWLGLRKARLFSQAIPFALIFGVTFCAGSLSLSVAQMNFGSSHPEMPLELQTQFLQLSHSPLVVMAQAAAGRLSPLLLLLGGALVLAWITLLWTERAFIEGSQNLAEHAGESMTSSQADAPFRTGLLGLEIRKSLRLIVRTPMMIVQCIAQVLTPVGIAFVLGHEDPARAVSFFVIFVAGVLSGILTIAAGTVEECEDLLGMAPRSPRLFRFGKMLSGCFWPMSLVLLATAGLLLTGHLLDAGAVFLGGVPLGLASSVVGETFATPVRPGMRPKLMADPLMLIPLLGMQIVSGFVAGATVFGAAFSPGWLMGSLLASYLVLVLVVGLAQLKKPLLS